MKIYLHGKTLTYDAWFKCELRRDIIIVIERIMKHPKENYEFEKRPFLDCKLRLPKGKEYKQITEEEYNMIKCLTII